jgi:hypothetical protein
VQPNGWIHLGSSSDLPFTLRVRALAAALDALRALAEARPALRALALRASGVIFLSRALPPRLPISAKYLDRSAESIHSAHYNQAATFATQLCSMSDSVLDNEAASVDNCAGQKKCLAGIELSLSSWHVVVVGISDASSWIDEEPTKTTGGSDQCGQGQRRCPAEP